MTVDPKCIRHAESVTYAACKALKSCGAPRVSPSTDESMPCPIRYW